MYLKRELIINLSKPFPNIRSETGQKRFMRCFLLFLCIGATFDFFERLGNVFLSLQFLNMIDSGFTKLLSHSSNILIDT